MSWEDNPFPRLPFEIVFWLRRVTFRPSTPTRTRREGLPPHERSPEIILMGMIGNLTRIPEDVRTALQRDPQLINKLLYPDFEEEPKRAGLLARLFGRSRHQANSPAVTLPSLGEDDSIDLDKAWHALHFLFTGAAWEGEFPQGFLVTCGEPVGDIDVGYGPARSFTPIQVKEIAAFLKAQSGQELRDKLDPKALLEAEIYPSIWSDFECTDQDWEYFGGSFEVACNFNEDAAKKDMALLAYIN